MPYATDFAGIYRVTDKSTGSCYIGQSRHIRKRTAEHFRLLRKGLHPNRNLQAAYDLSGEDMFESEVEVLCEDASDMDIIEEAFLQGEAKFDISPRLFNISTTARKPMEGRGHSEETKAHISKVKMGRTEHVTDEYRKKLSAGQRQAALSDPKYRAAVEYIVSHPDLSYAERGRVVGKSTSQTRKIALLYTNYKDT